jgi:hypothetical protein
VKKIKKKKRLCPNNNSHRGFFTLLEVPFQILKIGFNIKNAKENFIQIVNNIGNTKNNHYSN